MLKKYLWVFGVISLIGLNTSPQVLANDCGQTPEQMREQLSFSCLGTLEASGRIDPDANLSNDYDVSRQWQAGFHITQVLKLGDLAQTFSPQNFTVSQMIMAGGGDYDSVSVSQFPLIAQQSLEELVQAVPSLSNVTVSNFPGLESYPQDLSLSQLLGDYSFLQSTTLEDLGLGETALNAIPGLGDTALVSFTGWGDQYLSTVPYFSTIPLSSMPNTGGLSSNPLIARLDALRTSEGQQTRTLSGSYQEGFNVPCYDDCDYVELDDLENEGEAVSLPFEGIRWISGKKQKVRGGEGCLAGLNGGTEPTGTHPFGPAFKVVLWDVNPQKGEITTKLFFRIQMSCGLFGTGASPYFIGPVSWMTHKTNDLVVAGFAGQDFTGSVSSSEVNSPIVPNPTEVNSIDSNSVANSLPTNGTAQNHQSSSHDEQQPLSPLSEPPSEISLNLTKRQANFSWSAWQFSQVIPAQSYTATSHYLCHNDECGYDLGMFNLSSSDPFVIATVGKTNQGTQWLNNLGGENPPTKAQIKQFLPKPLQQTITENKLEHLATIVALQVDPLTQQPFEGRRKIQRSAQAYYGGVAAKIDGEIPIGLQGQSLLNASRNWVAIYQSRG